MSSDQTSAVFPIFLVGLPRSGSTLWSNVIGGHPDVAQFTEVHFLSVWHRDFRYILRRYAGDLSQEESVVRLLDVMFSTDHKIDPKNTIWFWNQIRRLEEKGLKKALYKRIMASNDREIGALFRILIEEATRCEGRKRVVVRFPVYPAYLRRLVQWWPEGKVVHITRDPRALAVSKSNDPGGVKLLEDRYPWLKNFYSFAYRYFAVFQYIWASHIHARFDGSPNYRLFLYEDLVSQPEKVTQELCEFCELDFDRSMLSPSAGQKSSVTGERASGFDPSRAEGWRRVLSPRETRFISYVTRQSMRRFGYEPKD